VLYVSGSAQSVMLTAQKLLLDDISTERRDESLEPSRVSYLPKIRTGRGTAIWQTQAQ
jgi:hypothetical protein